MVVVLLGRSAAVLTISHSAKDPVQRVLSRLLKSISVTAGVEGERERGKVVYEVTIGTPQTPIEVTHDVILSLQLYNGSSTTPFFSQQEWERALQLAAANCQTNEAISGFFFFSYTDMQNDLGSLREGADLHLSAVVRVHFIKTGSGLD